jgi:hypothetical protein
MKIVVSNLDFVVVERLRFGKPFSSSHVGHQVNSARFARQGPNAAIHRSIVSNLCKCKWFKVHQIRYQSVPVHSLPPTPTPQDNTKIYHCFCNAREPFHRADASVRDSSEAVTANPLAPKDFTALHRNDLLLLTLEDGAEMYLEFSKASRRQKGAIEALCEGELLLLAPDTDASGTKYSIESLGHWPRISDAWVKDCPGLGPALQSIRKAQREGNALPSQRCQRHGIAVLDRVGSLDDLESKVAGNPSFWCDGTAPGDAPPTPLQSALLSAGEIAAFLQGQRGVALVQLLLTFDPGTRLPLLRPYVLPLLQRVVACKGATVLPSSAAGGAATSLILCAKQAPYKAWASHLAQVGVQASLVADSPYYKLLIGKILGYKEANIIHHIQVSEHRA